LSSRALIPAWRLPSQPSLNSTRAMSPSLYEVAGREVVAPEDPGLPLVRRRSRRWVSGLELGHLAVARGDGTGLGADAVAVAAAAHVGPVRVGVHGRTVAGLLSAADLALAAQETAGAAGLDAVASAHRCAP